MHRPGECSRASSMHLRMQPEPCFILINPFSSASRHSSLFLSSTSLRFSPAFSLSLSHFSLFIFALPRSTLRPKRGESSPPSPPTFARQPPPSFSPSPPKTAPFSQLVSPFFTLLPTLDTRFHPPPTNTRLPSSLSLSSTLCSSPALDSLSS